MYLRGGAVSPHAAGVGAQVSVLQPLVVLRRRHWGHRGAVAETQTLQDEGRVNLSASQTQGEVRDSAWSLTDTSSPSRSSSTTTVSPADPKARSCNAQMRELRTGRISSRHEYCHDTWSSMKLETISLVLQVLCSVASPAYKHAYIFCLKSEIFPDRSKIAWLILTKINQLLNHSRSYILYWHSVSVHLAQMYSAGTDLWSAAGSQCFI